jgi:formate dehydrogenase major subunit
MNRRQFFKVCSAGLGGSSIALMGFSPTAALAEVRTSSSPAPPRHGTSVRIARCPAAYSSTRPATSRKTQSEIIHIEGDPDNPVNRGTLCPKGAGLLDMVRAPTV